MVFIILNKINHFVNCTLTQLTNHQVRKDRLKKVLFWQVSFFHSFYKCPSVILCLDIWSVLKFLISWSCHVLFCRPLLLSPFISTSKVFPWYSSLTFYFYRILLITWENIMLFVNSVISPTQTMNVNFTRSFNFELIFNLIWYAWIRKKAFKMVKFKSPFKTRVNPMLKPILLLFLTLFCWTNKINLILP